MSTTLSRLRRFFKRKFGFKLVFDTTFARELSSQESRAEFTQRYQNPTSSSLPVLASSCPGWICYAEKTHGELLPYISTVKSPQQIQGSLVKGTIAKQLCLNPTMIYHVTVMPCYDKKLEASRPDFLVEGAVEGELGSRHVDCVLTTAEVQKMLDEEGFDMQDIPMEQDYEPEDGKEERQFMPELLSPRGSSSGGALHDVIRHVRSLLSPVDAEKASVKVNPRRGSDYTDYTIHVEGLSEPIFKGAQCYGFRNLQNVVRKIGRERGVGLTRGKSAAAKAAAARRAARRGVPQTAADDGAGKEDDDGRAYDYVEVMACPSGCVNGGGQVVGVSGSARWVERVADTYWALAGGHDGEEAARSVWAAMAQERGELRTAYRAVQSSHVHALAVKW